MIEPVLAGIGAIAAAWYIFDRLFPLWRISWRRVQRAAKAMCDQLGVQGYSPTVIVGIGRGGAIFGSLISGCLGHRPILVIDREYIWVDGRRADGMLMRNRPPKRLLERVLLVAGEAHSGNTLRMYHEYLTQAGAGEIRKAVMLYREGCTEVVQYTGIRCSKNLRLPWMFTKEYARQSLSAAEVVKVDGTGSD